jgi:riboflavin kinase
MGGASVNITGRVITGIKKGSYFIGMHGYSDQISALFGFVPYPGTLNVLLSGKEIEKLSVLRRGSGFRIRGFESGGRRFGEVIAYRAETDGIPCAAVMPVLTTYKDILEIVSGSNLRERLALKDGVEITVKCFL